MSALNSVTWQAFRDQAAGSPCRAAAPRRRSRVPPRQSRPRYRAPGRVRERLHGHPDIVGASGLARGRFQPARLRSGRFAQAPQPRAVPGDDDCLYSSVDQHPGARSGSPQARPHCRASGSLLQSPARRPARRGFNRCAMHAPGPVCRCVRLFTCRRLRLSGQAPERPLPGGGEEHETNRRQSPNSE